VEAEAGQATPLAPNRELEVTPANAAQIRLVRLGTTLGRDGQQTVRFGVFQRVMPLLAVGENGVEAPRLLVRSADVVEYSYSVDQPAWESLGSVTVEQLGTVPAAGSASVSAPADGLRAEQAGERLELTLAPVRPNPSRGGALVAEVVLPSAGPARLELLDVMGRRVMLRELGSLGVGRHEVELAAERRLSPGVYLLRLTQGGSTRVTRAAVIE